MKNLITVLLAILLISSCSHSDRSVQKNTSVQQDTISQNGNSTLRDSSLQVDNSSQDVVDAKASVKPSINDYIAIVMQVDDENEIGNSPLDSIKQYASAKADKSIVLTRINMEEALQNAKTYKSCLITVGKHTVVLVTDFNKEVASGSWGCKMPMGKGYIKRGKISVKEDYINNIIGIPDAQKRMMYLFE